jgi:heme-degrading monooxygenase HmoA
MSMVVRATEAEIDVVRMNPAEAVEAFKRMLLPALEEQEGYEGCYVLLSDEGKVLVLTFWDSNEAARATRLSGFYDSQIQKMADLVVYRQSPGREAYDVVVAETPHEVLV